MTVLSVPVRAVVHHVRIVRQPAKVWVTTVKNVLLPRRGATQESYVNYAFMNARKKKKKKKLKQTSSKTAIWHFFVPSF